MFYYLYPVIGKERELPVYLTSVGKNDYQYHVNRKEGYYLHQFLYCEHGEGVLKVEGSTYLITPKTAFFLPAHVPHEYYTTGALWDTRWVAADGYALDSMLKSMNLEHASVFHIVDISPLDSILDRMRSAIMADDIFGNFSASGILYEFLTTFYQLSSEAFSDKSKRTASKLLPVIEYIKKHYNSMITMEDLCETISVSPQYLCRLFKNQLNSRPMEYVCQIRIQEAKKLLTNTSFPIGTIALQCGFENVNYFNKIFRKIENTTPGQYRFSIRVIVNNHMR
jgi:AraC-like DNA-binding protein